MKIIGFILFVIGIAFAIGSIILIIKAIQGLKELKNKDIKIEFKYSETEKEITEKKEPQL